MSNPKAKKLDLTEGYSSVIMGIDLGTTNSAVAVHADGVVPKLCPLGNQGQVTMQSCVQWNGGNDFTVGAEAYAHRFLPNVAYSVKRMMGSDERIRLTLPTGESRLFKAAELSGQILIALRKQANQYYPGLRKCVITVPAYFDQRQIEDTIEASKIAGLECIQILKEPTSASYIYSLLGHAKGGNILIYDLGGGTFDVTHISFLRKADIPSTVVTALRNNFGIDYRGELGDKSSLYYCRVLGTYGDMHLGGDDIDAITAKLALEESAVSLSERGKEELIFRCEQFKKSNVESTTNIIEGKEILIGQHHLRKATESIYDATLKLIKQIPEESIKDIKSIVLVGGSTKSKYIVECLQSTFPDKEISRVLDPDATVALGAGAVAKDLQDGKSAMYQDVLPMAIGVLKDGREVEVCIPNNTAMPYVVTRSYHTAHDNQEAISVDVYQGVSSTPEECTFLGKVRIDKIPPKPAGQVNVMLTLMLNAQGRLKVSVTVDGVSETKELIVDSIFNVSEAGYSGDSSGMSDEEIVGSKANLKAYFGEFRDDVEESLWDTCLNNVELLSLFKARRTAMDVHDAETVQSFTDKIWECL